MPGRHPSFSVSGICVWWQPGGPFIAPRERFSISRISWVCVFLKRCARKTIQTSRALAITSPFHHRRPRWEITCRPGTGERHSWWPAKEDGGQVGWPPGTPAQAARRMTVVPSSPPRWPPGHGVSGVALILATRCASGGFCRTALAGGWAQDDNRPSMICIPGTAEG